MFLQVVRCQPEVLWVFGGSREGVPHPSAHAKHFHKVGEAFDGTTMSQTNAAQVLGAHCRPQLSHLAASRTMPSHGCRILRTGRPPEGSSCSDISSGELVDAACSSVSSTSRSDMREGTCGSVFSTSSSDVCTIATQVWTGRGWENSVFHALHRYRGFLIRIQHMATTTRSRRRLPQRQLPLDLRLHFGLHFPCFGVVQDLQGLGDVSQWSCRCVISTSTFWAKLRRGRLPTHARDFSRTPLFTHGKAA